MNQIKLLILGMICLFGSQYLSAQGGATCATAQTAVAGTNNTSGLATSPGNGTDNAFKWFVYTATGCGSVTVSSCNGGSDTRLFVTSGTCAAPVAVANNDDACAMSAGGPAYASSVTFNVANGTTYYISWGNGWDNNPFAWTLAFTPSSVNNIGILGKSTEYTVIPKRQFTGTVPVTATVSNTQGVSNTGLTVTCNVATGAAFGTPVTTVTSASSTVPCGTVSNVAVGNVTLPTTPAVYRFVFSYTSGQIATDNNAADNMDTTFLIISDDFYARAAAYATGTIDGALGVTGSVAVPAEAFQGQRYDFPRADMIDSINFNMGGGSVGDTLYAKVYSIVAGVPTAVVAQSAMYIVPTVGPRDVTLALTTPFQVAAGSSYVIGITHRARGVNAAFRYSDRVYTPGAAWIKINAGAFSNPEGLGFPICYLMNPIFRPCMPITVTSTPTNALCTSASGSAVASSTQLATPVNYTYVWSNGQTTATATGLAAGSYTITATDQFGCSATGTATVGSTASPISVNASATFTSCTSNTGTATGTPTSGVSPYTFVWNNGQMAATATGLASGSYTVTATDANGCIGTASASVITPNGPTASQASTNVTCFGNNNGAINVTPTGGTGALTYAWSNGATTQDLAGLAPGTYSTTITDAASCAFSISNILVTQPAAVVASVATATNVACFGQNNGSIDINISGGNGNYIYLWSNNATTQDLTGLSAGSYSALVGDSNGCNTNIPATTITAPSMALGLSGLPTINNVLCFGQATGSVTGVASVVVGGTTPYNYLWSNGATTADLTGLTAGSYTGTVTDAHGCTFVSPSVPITGPTSAVTAAPTQVNITCNGAGNGSINTNATGGTAPLSYIWNNGATTANLTNLAFGPYRCTITDANGCTFVTSNIQITQPTPLNASGVVTDQTNTGANDGAINVSVSGGAAPYTYVWSNGATTQDVSGIGAGAFSVTITDTNGCTNTQSFNVITGVNGIASLNLFDVMPNPTSDILNVNIELNRVSDVRLELYSAAGQVIMTQGNPNVSAQQYQFNLSDLPVGVYFLRLSAGESNVVKRIIVNR